MAELRTCASLAASKPPLASGYLRTQRLARCSRVFGSFPEKSLPEWSHKGPSSVFSLFPNVFLCRAKISSLMRITQKTLSKKFNSSTKVCRHVCFAGNRTFDEVAYLSLIEHYASEAHERGPRNVIALCVCMRLFLKTIPGGSWNIASRVCSPTLVIVSMCGNR